MEAWLCRLLQLASPALPVGAFAYSQGLESAVESGAVRDEKSAAEWILGVLEHGFLRLDLPLFGRLFDAFGSGDHEAAERASAWLFAARGSAELEAEDRQLGRALLKVLASLELPSLPLEANTFASAFARAAVLLGVPKTAAASAFAFGWAENQAGAAMRLVPLGQSAGQRIIFAAGARISAGLPSALALEDHEIGAHTPGQQLAALAHETQYSRIFRS